MNEKATSNRIDYIDVVAGIMISWMILGHCRFHANYTLSFFKYLGFYMPWFFYKSGMFFSPKSSAVLLKKDSSKLLRYFVVYSFLGWIVWCICGLLDGSLSLKTCIIRPIGDFIHHGSIYGNGALWFLLTLFIVRQFSNRLVKQKIPPTIWAVICFILAYGLYIVGWHRYSWWVGNILSGTFFFLIGYWIKEREKDIILLLFSIFTYCLLFVASYAGWIDDFPYLYMHANKMYNGNYVLFYPVSIAGIVIINNLFRYLCKHSSFKILGYIGYNSMYFYVIHWILLIVALFVIKTYFNVESSVWQFVALLGVSITLLPLIIETLKFLKTKIIK